MKEEIFMPACSKMKLLRIGLLHWLHLTRPMREGEKRGFGPKSFISTAESHEVGGDGREA
jgi:hypothetical protein